MSLVWITRAQPGAEATAARVRAMGHAAWVAPLLAVQPGGAEPVELAGVGALAFTSANAVAAFAARSAERGLPVFAVGAATAAAARQAGFAEVTAADADVAALAVLILANRGRFAGEVLHPGAAELAGDLAGALAVGGLAARRLVLYATRPRPLEPRELARLPEVDVALIHSARAAKVLADHLADHPAPWLTALGISPAALRPLATAALAGKVAAQHPSEAALLRLIDSRP